jgi:hypothetical protein
MSSSLAPLGIRPRVDLLVGCLSGIKMPKTRKPKKIKSPKQPTRRSTRGRIPRGAKEELIKKYVEQSRILTQKNKSKRKEKSKFKKSVNNNLSSLFSAAMGIKKRRKSRTRKSRTR